MLLLAGYILLAPVFVLAPLAGLLLVSRPRSLREWWWLAGSAAWLVLYLQIPGTLVEQFARASGILAAGAFVVSVLWRPSEFFGRAMAALGLATLAVVMWCWQLGIRWVELVDAVAREWQAAYELWAQGSGGGGSAFLVQMESTVETWPPLYPGMIVLLALGGLALAWAWYSRIATRPLGPPLGRLGDFRFSDQFVWGLVAAIALLIAPIPAPADDVGRNLLLIWGTLYAVRGLGVVSAGARRTPRPIVATLGVVALLLLPLATAGLMILGLTDTWLDFRRRLASAPTGGLDR